MGRTDLKCLYIGEKPRLYLGILEVINTFGFNLRVKKINSHRKDIINALSSSDQGVGIVFISDQASFPLSKLSDLIWQFSPDTIVVILTDKIPSVSFNKPLNNIVFSRLNVTKVNRDSQLFLGSLIHISQLRRDFRKCKRLLGVSEKRCQWLVDTSKEAIAYVSRDMHLYSNTVYADLFGVETLNGLHTVSLQDLIVEDEYSLFKDFVEAQFGLSQSLLLSMKKSNGEQFRARVIAVPSVFKGKKCTQLWVKNTSDRNDSHEENKKYSIHKMESLMNQQKLKRQAVYSKNDENEEIVKEVTTSLEVLKGVIRRKEVTITAKKLVDLKAKKSTELKSRTNYLLSLKSPVSLKNGIEKLLFYPASDQNNYEQSIFWDKVKYVRLLQFLRNKNIKNQRFIIRLSANSACDKNFSSWLISNLKKNSSNTSNLTFLFPVGLDKDQRVRALSFIKRLRCLNCEIALEGFSVSPESLTMLRKATPDMVYLSDAWVKSIEGNDSLEKALASFVRQIESRGIKVIAPCGQSESIKRLFILSGASFCQEKVSNTG